MRQSMYVSWLPVISQKSSVAQDLSVKTTKLLTPLDKSGSQLVTKRKSVDLNSKHNFKVLFSHDPKKTKMLFGLGQNPVDKSSQISLVKKTKSKLVKVNINLLNLAARAPTKSPNGRVQRFKGSERK